MSDEMEEIIAEFITEAEESLDRIDPLFVELEAKGFDKDILNDIFRGIHTIKGAAGFLGFQPIVDVSHNSENILKKLRDGEIVLSKPLIDVVLKSVDMLRLQLRHLRDKDGIEEDISPLISELDSTLKSAQYADTPLGMSQTAQAPNSTSEINVSLKSSDVIEQSVDAGKQVTPTAISDKGLSEKKESIQTLRVDVERIDKVMNLTGEVVLARNRLLNLINYLERKYNDDAYIDSLLETVAFLDLVASDMQLAVMRMRMQPIQKVFNKFPRLVRDISTATGKDVNLIISGEDTEVDKSVIEHIGDPMVHIIRNAVDHGLESPDERRAKGKPEKCSISISAYQKGNQIVIEVSDDGKGIDIEKIKKKAVSKGLITEDEAQKMTDESAINLIFLPGFSTKDVSTEISGRGVGMDVVKTNISKLNGYVEVISKKDVGTTFRISIPLTLAIIHTLMVRAGSARYAIPLAPTEEIIKIPQNSINDIMGQKVIKVRGNVQPLFKLSDILGDLADTSSDQKYAVVVLIGDNRFCLAVDEVLGQEEVVVKTIDGIDTGSSHIMGATITGDGKVVLILDLASISRSVLGLVKKI